MPFPTDYDAFFQCATGNVPYAYQRRLAGVPPASEIQDPKSQMRPSAPCNSQLISIPTGLGKTAAVVLPNSTSTQSNS